MNSINQRKRAVALMLAIATPALGYSAAPSPSTLKLEKARATHPNMQIIRYHQPEQENSQIQILYKNPPEHTLHTMTINSQTGEIIKDHAYKETQKAPILKLEDQIKLLQTQYPIKRINKVVLNKNGTRTIHYVDKHKQQKTIIADAKTGKVIESKSNRHRSH